MLTVTKLDATEGLIGLKHQYLQLTTAPLDDMWLLGFVPQAAHYAFYDDMKLVGYCCVNDEGYLLQFHVSPSHQRWSASLFASLLQPDSPLKASILGAYVSTAEPRFMSLCLDAFAEFEVNALMYRQAEGQERLHFEGPIELSVVQAAQLAEAVAFVKASIGAPEGWLTTYLGNLIARNELYGHWKDGCLIATGENRRHDEFLTEYADIGVIVGKAERGRGLATRIIRHLADMNDAEGFKSNCSTEKGNIGAQKAIERAGFFASNRIVQFRR